jgi:hypothetical protein
VLAQLEHEQTLVDAGILAQPMARLAQSWAAQANARLAGLGFGFVDLAYRSGGRDRSAPSEGFRWLWGEFTSVSRSEAGATW